MRRLPETILRFVFSRNFASLRILTMKVDCDQRNPKSGRREVFDIFNAVRKHHLPARRNLFQKLFEGGSYWFVLNKGRYAAIGPGNRDTLI